MAVLQKLSSLLNYEIKIDLNKQVTRRTAFILLILFAVFLIGAGYFIGDRWFWVSHQNYLEYQKEVLRESLNKNPKQNSIKVELAMADYLDGNASGAIKALRDILRREPGNWPAVLYLGLILSEQKEYKESIDLLTKYVGHSNGFETRIAYLYLGKSYLSAGSYRMAEKHLKTAAERDPANPLVYYWLGQTYEKMKATKSAVASYEKALAISPDFMEADTALRLLVGK